MARQLPELLGKLVLEKDLAVGLRPASQQAYQGKSLHLQGTKHLAVYRPAQIPQISEMGLENAYLRDHHLKQDDHHIHVTQGQVTAAPNNLTTTTSVPQDVTKEWICLLIAVLGTIDHIPASENLIEGMKGQDPWSAIDHQSVRGPPAHPRGNGKQEKGYHGLRLRVRPLQRNLPDRIHLRQYDRHHLNLITSQ